ncbi:hypothetical protein A2U01_0063927, partial [Trifolium medium]|nr:hypothetical protein [Trifolium medium]
MNIKSEQKTTMMIANGGSLLLWGFCSGLGHELAQVLSCSAQQAISPARHIELTPLL